MDKVIILQKPYTFEGKEYIKVDLNGLDDLTATDICKIEKLFAKQGNLNPAMAELTMDYALLVAYKVTKLPVEFFRGLNAKDAIKIKGIVSGFLFSEELDQEMGEELEKMQ